jgi:hypothetical protein
MLEIHSHYATLQSWPGNRDPRFEELDRLIAAEQPERRMHPGRPIPRYRGSYSQEQRDQVIELAKQGLPNTVISMRTGIPRRSVWGMLSRAVIPLRHPPKADRRFVTELEAVMMTKLHDDGMSYAQIGHRFGVKGPTVCRVVKRQRQ